MKKIVALVLCLALALSLCTVAFADTSVSVKKDGYKTITMDAYNTADDALTKDITKVTVDSVSTTTDGKTTVTYKPSYYVIEGVNYYVVDASIATKKLVKDGAVVAFLSTVAPKATSDVVTAKIDKKDADDRVCGDYAYDVYTVDGTDYVAADSTTFAADSKTAMYNGKFVALGAKAASAINHTWDKKATDAAGKLLNVTCKTCEKTYQVVKSIPDNYTGSTLGTVDFNGTTYTVLKGATAASGSSSTVESAKTFDAGIALYAGMALASVAGSAVVIGKKKEF